MERKAKFLTDGDEPKLLRFLDDAFGFETERNGFLKQLPKLYRSAYHPGEHNLAFAENGSILASVGIYPVTLQTPGGQLRCAGIGNMAVAKSHRGQGLMRTLMTELVSELRNGPYDFAMLGGQRQRYEAFGFYPGGEEREFTVTDANIKHCFGSGDNPLTIRKTGPEDTREIELIRQLHDRQPYHAVRPAEGFYDILCSWNYEPFTVWQGDSFRGYFLRKGDEIRELVPENPEDLPDLIRAVPRKSDLKLIFQAYDRKPILRISAFAESEWITQWEKLLVLRWIPVLGGAMPVRALSARLDPGSLTLRIDRETITITVAAGNRTEVRAAKPDEAPLVSLTYKEAMTFFFGRESPQRELLPSPARWWFPLPLSMRMADHV